MSGETWMSFSWAPVPAVVVVSAPDLRGNVWADPCGRPGQHTPSGCALLLVAYGMAPALATLVVAVATLVIGTALLWFGVNRLSATNLAPSKTIKQLQKDANIVQKR